MKIGHSNRMSREWWIYALLGLGILLLLICIVWILVPQFSQKKEPIVEGMLDYYNIEDYLKTLPTTQGRFVRIRPSLTSGDGYMTISQVQVLDMNDNNIALKQAVTATSTAAGSASVSTTVDGNTSQKSGLQNVWTSGSSNKTTEYWQVDLGSVQQISEIVITTLLTTSASTSLKIDMAVMEADINILNRSKGMIVEILDGTGNNVVTSQKLPTTTVTQSLRFQNAINFTPYPTGNVVSAMNPLIIPVNYAQPEVYLVKGSYTKSQASMVCAVLGATVATQGQLKDAWNNGADWPKDMDNNCGAGWTDDGTDAYYAARSAAKRTDCATNGVGTFASNSLTNLASAPAGQGAFATATANVNCFGIKPAAGVNSTIQPFSLSAWSQYVANSTAKYFGTNTLSVPNTDKMYLYVKPRFTNGVKFIDPPNAWAVARPDLSGTALYNALITSAPFNFLYDEATTSVDVINSMNDTITVFGTVSPAAIAEMNASLDLCKKIFLGSTDDVDKFINISYDTLLPYMRANTGWAKFCRVEVIQSVDTTQLDFVINLVAANQTFNQSNCAVPITTDMLGLLPYTSRSFLINWIKNRTQRIIEFKAKTTGTTIPPPIPMTYTAGGKPISIDITSKYTVDKIAQAFYEAMGGNYTMSLIYDIFTIGSTIVDIRFDLTKHADISALKKQVATLQNIYYSIRASNVSRDILDSAKENYQTSLQNLQSLESNNTLPPIQGMVGRFFYTYNTATGGIVITGFTLDIRAVTSFIPELNGGTIVSTGGDAGTLNYTPVIQYTKNIPEALVCDDPIVLRRMMDDYLDASTTDLADTLLGTKNADGTYTGPVGAPTVDTSIGTIHINKILGSLQVSPTQCAVKWTETLWNDLSNAPVSVATTNITRRALITYAVNTADWYSSSIDFDISGFMLYPGDTVPECKFNPTLYRDLVSPRFDKLDITKSDTITQLKQDFITNVFNNGNGNVCPDVLPTYIFNPSDYAAANKNVNTTYNNGGKGPIDVPSIISYYAKTGITSDDAVRSAQTITPLSSVITIEQPMPANSTLDNGSESCPSTNCEDTNVLYSLVDQYNQDPTQAGVILRVTRAFTPNPNQCDIEIDINYDAQTQNGAGNNVLKGSFTYDDNGNEVPVALAIPVDSSFTENDDTDCLNTTTLKCTNCTNVSEDVCAANCLNTPNCGGFTYANKKCSLKSYPPSGGLTDPSNAGAKCVTAKGTTFYSRDAVSTPAVETRAMTVHVDQNDCNYVLDSTDIANSGNSIQKNTPALYRPMEYTKEFKQTNETTLIDPINQIVSAISDAAQSASSILNSYRTNTYEAVGNIAYLGNCPTSTCGSTTNLNAMLAFYKKQNTGVKQINTVLRLGTPNSTTCDLTVQEDTLGPGPVITSSKTSGLRFTMTPGAVSCTFSPTSMSYILPSPPPDVVMDMKQTPSSATCTEVYGVSGNSYTQVTAAAKCASYGGTLATMAQLTASQKAGADWCTPGFLADMSGTPFYPISSARSGCGSGTGVQQSSLTMAGANCYGVKPKQGLYSDVLAFVTAGAWNQPNACPQAYMGGAVNYVNPSKEAFTNYGKPIQVSDSSFPANINAFGLDLARNTDGPELDTMFREPLRQNIKPVMNPKDIKHMQHSLEEEEASKGKMAYKFIRFRPLRTRYPNNKTVDVSKFRFFFGKHEIDMHNAKVTNPMGTWIGDVEDVTGPGYTSGWSDAHKKPIVFAFPHATIVDGFTWTTANPDKGLGGDPVQWKLEGSTNGVYWTVLRDQTRHNFPVTETRFQDLSVFRF